MFVGHHKGTPLWIGRLDEVGFVATPPSIAGARLRDERARYVAGTQAMEGPPVAMNAHAETAPDEIVRALRHPDGRRWEIRTSGKRLQLRVTDDDGDEHTRSRASSDPLWEAQALVRDQALEGFVEEP